jgi:hypothetical protein
MIAQPDAAARYDVSSHGARKMFAAELWHMLALTAF